MSVLSADELALTLLFDPSLKEVDSLCEKADEGEGHWVTINGEHVFFKFGVGDRVVRNPAVSPKWKDSKHPHNKGVILAHEMGKDNKGRKMKGYRFRSDSDAADLKNPAIGKWDKPFEKGTWYGEPELRAEKRSTKEALTQARWTLRDVEESLAALREAEDADGTWVTLNGVHVLIKDGEVTKGPKTMVGKKVSELKKHLAHKVPFSPKAQEVLNSLPRTSEYGTDRIDDELSALANDDPAFDDFVSAASDWTNGEYRDISKASELLNKNKPEQAMSLFDKGVLREAEILNSAVLSSTPQKVEVYRGISTVNTVPELENADFGSTVNVAGVRSFSYRERTAHGFLGTNTNHYVVKIEGLAKGVNLATLSQHPQEQEFMTQGKFEVIGVKAVKAENSYGVSYKMITIRQKAVFAPRSSGVH